MEKLLTILLGYCLTFMYFLAISPYLKILKDRGSQTKLFIAFPLGCPVAEGFASQKVGAGV